MGTLNQKQLDHFEEFGFLKIDNILDPESVIDPIIEEYKIVLDKGSFTVSASSRTVRRGGNDRSIGAVWEGSPIDQYLAGYSRGSPDRALLSA